MIEYTELEKKISEFIAAETEHINIAAEWRKKADALTLALSILNGHDADALAKSNKSETQETPSEKDIEKVKSGRIIDKVLWIIQANNRFMYRKEIEEYAENAGMAFTGVISSTMSESQATTDLIMVNSGGHRVWGLKAWTFNGSIVPKYNHIKNDKYFK